MVIPAAFAAADLTKLTVDDDRAAGAEHERVGVGSSGRVEEGSLAVITLRIGGQLDGAVDLDGAGTQRCAATGRSAGVDLQEHAAIDQRASAVVVAVTDTHGAI